MNVFVTFIIFVQITNAQTHLRIHHSGGSHIDVPVAQIDSISFLDTDSLNVLESELSGSWLWGNKEKGYYELLSFNKDHTYTAYDNYFTCGFDTTTYGFYSQYSAMLTLWSDGFGYQHRYNWYITELSENAFSVMTKMGPFTYYKLQEKGIQLKVGESMTCNSGDSYIFADGIVAKIEDENLVGVIPGTTYIEKLIAVTNTIHAYKVIVE